VPEETTTTNPIDAVKDAAESVEGRFARAMEGLVARDGFGEVLALVAGNTAAIVKRGSDSADQMIRAMRLAGRRDVVDLSRQLARTEDKLERVLQEVEALQDQSRRTQAPIPKAAVAPTAKAAKKAARS
jgi:hypothetical protein